MFAYCLNNPVNRFDVTGSVSLWYILVKDSDMGFIHRCVVNHIGKKYRSVQTEKPLSTYGRADVVNTNTKEVWEVKHAGTKPWSRMAEATAQAWVYIAFNRELEKLGSAHAFNGTFYIKCWDYYYIVNYTTPAEGAVLYTIREVYNHNGQRAYVYVPAKEKSYYKLTGLALPAVPVFAGGFAGGGGSGKILGKSYSLI